MIIYARKIGIKDCMYCLVMLLIDHDGESMISCIEFYCEFGACLCVSAFSVQPAV